MPGPKIGICLILALAAGACACRTAEPFSGQNAFAELLRLDELGPRFPGHENHSRVRDYLIDRIEKAGGRVRLDEFEFTDAATGQILSGVNIVGEFAGRGVGKVLIGSHWDTRRYADLDPDPKNRRTPIPGANDGNSGTALLLEMLRVIRDRRPPVGVTVVFFDAEDWGTDSFRHEYCIGSMHFAETLRKENAAAEYRFAIVPDMVAEKDAEFLIEQYSIENAPEITRKIWDTAEVLGYRQFVNRTGRRIRDDHRPLQTVGIPSVLIIDLDYPPFHTMQDTPDKCCPGTLEAVGRVIETVLYAEPVRAR